MLEVAIAAFGVPVINNQMMVAFWQPVFEKKKNEPTIKVTEMELGGHVDKSSSF
jgi:hypothetical protein